MRWSLHALSASGTKRALERPNSGRLWTQSGRGSQGTGVEEQPMVGFGLADAVISFSPTRAAWPNEDRSDRGRLALVDALAFDRVIPSCRDTFHGEHRTRGVLMAMLKVIEVLAESSKSREDAAQTAVGRANETATSAPSILRTWKRQSRMEGSKPTASTLRSHSRLKTSRHCKGTSQGCGCRSAY